MPECFTTDPALNSRAVSQIENLANDMIKSEMFSGGFKNTENLSKSLVMNRDLSRVTLRRKMTFAVLSTLVAGTIDTHKALCPMGDMNEDHFVFLSNPRSSKVAGFAAAES